MAATRVTFLNATLKEETKLSREEKDRDEASAGRTRVISGSPEDSYSCPA